MTNRNHILIAIDGPAASGKGTLARKLAQRFGLAYLDTGLIYRAVGLKFLQQDPTGQNAYLAVKLAKDLKLDDLQDEGLRGSEAGNGASIVGAIPAVRDALLHFQRELAHNPGEGYHGAVLDGRDIGTVICPDADVKLFIKADLAERAKRRHTELVKRGYPSTLETVLKDLTQRDERDRNRATAPLVAADDAITIDTSRLDAEAVLEEALRIVTEKCSNKIPS